MGWFEVSATAKLNANPSRKRIELPVETRIQEAAFVGFDTLGDSSHRRLLLVVGKNHMILLIGFFSHSGIPVSGWTIRFHGHRGRHADGRVLAAIVRDMGIDRFWRATHEVLIQRGIRMAGNLLAVCEPS